MFTLTKSASFQTTCSTESDAQVAGTVYAELVGFADLTASAEACAVLCTHHVNANFAESRAGQHTHTVCQCGRR